MTATTLVSSLFDNTIVPSDDLQNINDPNIPSLGGAELGLKFRSDVAGYITGVRFWKGSLNTGTHTGELWSSGGQLLATATFSNETGSGWQQVTFSNPVAIAANTTYIAAYHTTAAYITYGANAFRVSYDNAQLHALANGVDGNNSVYHYGSSVFPDQYNGQAGSYAVDVVFSSTSTATPTSLFGNISPTTNSQIVTDPNVTTLGGVELGLKFRSDVAGEVTGIRFWKGSPDTSSPTGEIWTSAGQLLATVTFTNQTNTGWQQATFSSPVVIVANATYIVSYHTTSPILTYTSGLLSNGGVDSKPLHALAEGVDGDNSVYHYGNSAFPDLYNGQAGTYWVDVIFVAP